MNCRNQAPEPRSLRPSLVKVRKQLHRINTKLILVEPKTERSRRTLVIPLSIVGVTQAMQSDNWQKSCGLAQNGWRTIWFFQTATAIHSRREGSSRNSTGRSTKPVSAVSDSMTCAIPAPLSAPVVPVTHTPTPNPSSSLHSSL